MQMYNIKNLFKSKNFVQLENLPNLYTKTPIKNNIFTQDVVNKNCRLLNKYNGSLLQNSFYEMENSNIIKYYRNDDEFSCELILHQYLSNKNITLDFDIDLQNKTLCYNITNEISIHDYLESCNNYPTIIILLNELFGFINTFKKYHLLHGNLHIHNIYINPTTLVMYAIDFTNSKLYLKSEPIELVYHDFYTIYHSLNTYFTKKSDHKSLEYMKSLLLNYT